MAEDIKPPSSFVRIDDASISTPTKTSVYQYIDILNSDISSSLNRKNYEVFVTGGINQATVKSTLYQTIFDQDFTLSTSNPLFDLTFGMLKEDVTLTDGTIVPEINGKQYEYDSAGKVVGFSDELMIREKVNIYRQFAQLLLGDADAYFTAPHMELVADGATKIKKPLFLTFRRLFTRDNIYKGTFNLLINRKTALLSNVSYDENDLYLKGEHVENISTPYTASIDNSALDTIVVSDAVNSSNNVSISPVSGEVTTLTADIGGEQVNVGLIYYDKGIVVLDTDKIFDSNQVLRGKIDSTSQEVITGNSGPWFYNYSGELYENLYTNQVDAEAADVNGLSNFKLIGDTNFYQPAGDNVEVVMTDSVSPNLPIYEESSTFYTDAAVTVSEAEAVEGVTVFNDNFSRFCDKASIEDILTHICVTRFSDANETAIVFQNESIINSRIYICRVAPSQLNYSTNPTFIDSEGNIIPKVGDKTFTFVTSIGLFDAAGNMVAVAKTSRPIEKNPETDLSINVRLDF